MTGTKRREHIVYVSFITSFCTQDHSAIFAGSMMSLNKDSPFLTTGDLTFEPNSGSKAEEHLVQFLCKHALLSALIMDILIEHQCLQPGKTAK